MKHTAIVLLCGLLAGACILEGIPPAGELPHKGRWGIYFMTLDGRDADLIYDSPTTVSNVRLDPQGAMLAFSMNVGTDSLPGSEIFTLDLDDRREKRLTDNDYPDTYPVWSPDGGQLAYLSWPGATLDIYVMGKDGGGSRLLYDSGDHDGDIDWVGDKIVFTRNSEIWIMDSDGTHAQAVTHPPRAGVAGKANLPFGDYDPRMHPDGTSILFERLEDDSSPFGNYDFYRVDVDGSDLVRLTRTGYTQGLAQWSPAGDAFLCIVTATGSQGAYDLHLRNADGADDRNLTPAYFPANVLIHEAVFSRDGRGVYFIAEWWE
jgi:Tol biopolymer transport system component